MPSLEELTCANCGAALRAGAVRGTVVTCEHCGTTFRLARSSTPEPDMGDLLLGADFCNPEVPGWRVFEKDKLTFKPGPPCEMWVDFPASKLIHAILQTPGPFDDCDASVTARFLEGTKDEVSCGFEIRSGDDGDYVIRISAQSTYQVGWHKASEWGGALVNWTTHPSLRGGFGVPNRLRVVARGEQLRVYINGVLATSLRDPQFKFGRIRLVISPPDGEGMTAAFSDLQLREAS